MEISIFKKKTSPESPFIKDVSVFFDRIKNGSPATELILKYRETKDPVYKNQLPACSFGGVFSYRNEKSLIKFSGLACLDFDKLSGIEDANQIKDNLISDPCLYACFISPSGVGVKAVFRVADDHTKYRAMYRALCSKYADVHLDSKTSDISRLCFESYDPDIYINEQAEIWTKCEEEEYQNLGASRYDVSIPVQSESITIGLLQKWFDKKYTVSEGQRNDAIYRFASALNAFGVNEYTSISYLQKYAQKGFSAKEIETAVKSAYKRNKSEFNTKAFEDNETKRMLQKSVSNGKTTKEIRSELESTNNPIVKDENFELILTSLKSPDTTDVFWAVNDKGKISIVAHKFEQYLISNNFMKFYPESTSETFIFVQKDKSLIEFTNRDRIKDFVLKDLKTRENIGLAPFDFMAVNTKFFSNEFLNMIEAVDIKLKTDTADKCYLYFKNCVVEVGVDYSKTIDYLDLDSYVWKDSVIDRDYHYFDHHGGEFRSFIWYISGQDEHSYNCFKSVIGYLLHSFKTQANNKAIILNDEMISDDEPNGRSGKGLFFNGIKHLKKLESLNGKKIDLNGQFTYQTVKADCQVLVYDDVKKNFPFEDLFSIITEGLTIEYKGQGAIKLPVTKSPKIVITTNYTIKGNGGSFDARKHELELSSYFNSNYSPQDKFGHLLFDDWSNEEWQRFDNFMIQCIQYYLQNGLQKQKHKNLELRKLIGETSTEFIEWTSDGNLEFDTRHYNEAIFEKFLKAYPDYRNGSYKLPIKRFKKWVKLYCEHYNYFYANNMIDNIGRYFYISKNKITETDITEPF
jgi:hypothetical protein